MCARIKDTIIEKQDTGVDKYGTKTNQEELLKKLARNERERNGISRNHFTDSQITYNPFEYR